MFKNTVHTLFKVSVLKNASYHLTAQGCHKLSKLQYLWSLIEWIMPLMTNDMNIFFLTFLNVLIFHLYISLAKDFFMPFGYFLVGLFGFFQPIEFREFFMWIFYQISFASIFLQAIACLFIIFTWSFTKEKILVLVKFSLSFFSSILWIILFLSYLRTHID